MNRNKPVYPWEREIVRLKYYEHLTRREIGEKVGRTLNEVRHILSKTNVKRYIQKEVLPTLWRKKIAELEDKLKDRDSQIRANAEYLKAEYNAQSYIWLGPGKKVYKQTGRFWQRHSQALGQHSRILGLTDPSHAERNCRRYVLKHAAKLRKRLELLKEKLREVEEIVDHELEK